MFDSTLFNDKPRVSTEYFVSFGLQRSVEKNKIMKGSHMKYHLDSTPYKPYLNIS